MTHTVGSKNFFDFFFIFLRKVFVINTRKTILWNEVLSISNHQWLPGLLLLYPRPLWNNRNRVQNTDLLVFFRPILSNFFPFSLTEKKNVFNASPGSRKDTFHSLSGGPRPNQGHLQVSPPEREVWKRAWKLILDQKLVGYLTPEQFSTAAAEVIFTAFLPHHSEEQMRASTYGRDAHPAVVSAPGAGKPDGLLTLDSMRRKKKKTCSQLKEIHQS